MEKRILIAFLLSLVVLYGSRLLFPPRPPAAPTEQASSQPAPQSNTPATPPAKPSINPELPAPKPESSSAQQPLGDVQAETAEDVQVETPLYTATLSNHGAVLKSFRLKAPYTDAEGKSIELIDSAGAAKVGWPLAVSTNDSKLDDQIANANFVLKRESTRVSLEYGGNGVHLTKDLEFDPNNYQITVDSKVFRDGKPVRHSVVWQGGFGDQSIPPNVSTRQVVYSPDDSFKRIAVSGIKAPQDLTVSRIGIEDQYFVAMFLQPGNATAAKVEKKEYPGPANKPVATSAIAITANDKPLRFYVGPKEPVWLNKADPQLSGIIDYGTFTFIAKPLN